MSAANLSQFGHEHLTQGIALRDSGQFQEAYQSFQKALQLNPQSVETYFHLGVLFEKVGQYEAAIQAYQNAIVLKPDYANAHYNLGNLQMLQSHFAEAVQSYQQAVKYKPDFGYAYCNLGSALSDLGRVTEAIASYRQALQYLPEDGETHFNLGLLLLAQGNFSEGWQEHEYRYHPSVDNPAVRVPALPFPQWQGQSLQGKSILIWFEQGLGDTIQFSRYVTVLKQQANKVTLLCNNALNLLLTSLAGVDEVLSEFNPVLHGHYDYWTFPLSIPLRCQTTLENIPANVPYLSVASELLKKWQTQLPQGKKRIGLIWKGSPTHKNDANRSLPSLQILEPWWNVGDCHFISLQKGQGEEEIPAFAAHHPLIPLGGQFSNFADTAAVIMQLDCVISVDTSVAHLAGALGKPVWLLLPYIADWRWMIERNDNPWYPTMRLFRQPKWGDWQNVIQAVSLELQQFLRQ